MQMNFTAMALILRDEATIGRILRENNRFNSTLAEIEEAAGPEEREAIQRIRSAQEEVLTTVADIANLVRDGRVEEAMALQLTRGFRSFCLKPSQFTDDPAEVGELCARVVRYLGTLA